MNGQKVVDMNMPLLDLYSDYLITSFSYTTATGLSAALGGVVSHDKITRFLAADTYDSKQLWELVKPMVRKIESEDGVLIFDDTVEEKLYTDENDLIAWHFDHTFGRNIKGINIVGCLYHTQGMNIPVSFALVKKTKTVIDSKTGKERRKSEKTKNEYLQEMALQCVQNQIKFRYVLADVWFSSNDTMEYVKYKLKKEFIMPIKSNRLIALSAKDKKAGHFQHVASADIEPHTAYQAYLKELPFPVILVKQVFTNEDGSSGVLYLICSDEAAGSEKIMDVYQKRWQIEEYHKSLKSNIGLSKSPTQTVRTQANHFFASIYAYYKLEILKSKTKLNHFALKARLYVQALRSSMVELERIKVAYHCVR